MASWKKNKEWYKMTSLPPAGIISSNVEMSEETKKKMLVSLTDQSFGQKASSREMFLWLLIKSQSVHHQY